MKNIYTLHKKLTTNPQSILSTALKTRLHTKARVQTWMVVFVPPFHSELLPPSVVHKLNIST